MRRNQIRTWIAAAALASAAAGCGDDLPAQPAAAGAISPLWTKHLPSPDVAEVLTVAATRGGDLVVGGYFRDRVDLGGGEVMAVGDTDGFVAGFRADGTLRWLALAAGAGGDSVSQVAVGPNDDIFVTGAVGGAGRLFGAAVDGGAGSSVFVARLDGDGAPLWVRLGGATGHFQAGVSLAPDGAGGLFVGGDFSGVLDLGGGPMAGDSGTSIFVARLDGAGAPLWARTFSGGTYEATQRVAAGPDGSVALLSRVDGVIDFGSGPVVGGGEFTRPLLVASFGPDGRNLWSQLVTGDPLGHETHEHSEDSRSLAIGRDGIVRVSLSFHHGLEHGFETPDPPYLRLLGFARDGTPTGDQHDFRGLGDSTQRDGGLVVDASGAVHLSGSFRGELRVDDVTLTAPISRYMFLVDLDARGARSGALDYGDDGTGLVVNDLTIDARGFRTAVGYWRAAGTAEIHPFLARFSP
jgi:hypothetical protein